MAGFLPAAQQATLIRAGRPSPIYDLFPPQLEKFTTKESGAGGLKLLKQMNTEHAAARQGNSRLDARIASYELVAKLQLSTAEVLDISRESTRKLYGTDDLLTSGFGRNCLVAHRMLERGVRFVQVWSGVDNGFPRRNWDSHEDLKKDHWNMTVGMDKPAAALIKDLKSRGLLEDTIVYWTTEFGRMPCSQGSRGRDHNPSAFTSWLAGGGIKGGAIH